jgi:VIT1/CCC1 family predicted Fe2+/Mn2+ transporter
MKPDQGLLARWLDPIDRLSETIFAILIVLLFTVGFRIYMLGNDPSHAVSADFLTELLIAAFGAAVAWGMVDGLFYALFSMFGRGEKHRLLMRIQTATTEEEGIEAIAEELDFILEPIAPLEKRQLLYADVLEHLHDSDPQPVTLKREDVTGALACVLVAIVAVLPSLTPLLLLRNYGVLALRVSNVVSFGVLFYSGYQWGKYSGSNPWKIGLLLVAFSAIIVLVAIPFGG